MHLLTPTPSATSFKEGVWDSALTDGQLCRGEAGERGVLDHQAWIPEVTRI